MRKAAALAFVALLALLSGCTDSCGGFELNKTTRTDASGAATITSQDLEVRPNLRTAILEAETDGRYEAACYDAILLYDEIKLVAPRGTFWYNQSLYEWDYLVP